MDINRQNYEECLVMYIDDELDVREREAVEEFISANPDICGEFELLRGTKLTADVNPVFEDKKSLYRHEKQERTIFHFKWQYAAAAVMLLIAGIFTVNKYLSLQEAMSVADTAEIKDSRVTRAIKEVNIEKTKSVSGQSEEKQFAKSERALEQTQTLAQKNKSEILVEVLPDNSGDMIVKTVTHTTAPDEASAALAIYPSGSNLLVSAENSGKIEIAAAPPGEIGASLVHTASTPVTAPEQAEASGPANYLQTRKNSIKNFLRKATRIIETTAELRHTQEINVRLGNVEIAVH